MDASWVDLDFSGWLAMESLPLRRQA